MRVLIIGMPRTRTTALLSMLGEGGFFPVYEPFHPSDAVHEQYNPGLLRYRKGKRRIAYLNRFAEENKDIAVKTLFPQQEKACAVALAKWADVILVTNRDLLQIICSVAVSLDRGEWHGEDENRDKVRVSRRTVQRLCRFYKRRESVVSAMRKANPNIHELNFEQAVDSDYIKGLGISCGEPKVVKCRDCQPSEMVNNLDQVKHWVQNEIR